MKRAEAEVVRKLDPDPEHSHVVEPDVRIGDFIVQRRCPHRNADLAAFGEIDGDELVCTLHGWRFDVDDRKMSDRRGSTDPDPPGRTVRVNGGDQAPSWTQTGMPIGIRLLSQIQSIAGTLTRTQPCDAG